MFNLDKQDDVTKYVVKRDVTVGDKVITKSPKVQRLVTDTRVRRKKLMAFMKFSQLLGMRSGLAMLLLKVFYITMKLINQN